MSPLYNPASSAGPAMKVSTGWKTVRPLDSGAFGAPTQSLLLCTPLQLWTAETWDRVGTRCSATAGGSTVRLGVYSDTGSGYPGALVADFGTIDTATATGDLTITISQAMTSGLYWLAAVSQGGAPSVRTVNVTPHEMTYYTGATPFNFGVGIAWGLSSVTGALPATFTAGQAVTGAATHRVYVRTV
jgi:hypothetical protein